MNFLFLFLFKNENQSRITKISYENGASGSSKVKVELMMEVMIEKYLALFKENVASGGNKNF